MNDTLKAVGNIGAELAAAKADLQKEMERHRKTWRQLESLRDVAREALAVIERLRPANNGMGTIVRLKAALFQQAEPRCEHCDGAGDVHRADGEWLGECKECNQAEPAPAQETQYALDAYIKALAEHYPIEPAPAQDEREAVAAVESEEWLQAWARGKFTYAGRYKGQVYGNTDWALARALHGAIVAEFAPIAQTEQPEHFDDRAVDRFAAAMKAKLAKARGKGRGGWFDRLQCSEKRLAQMLVEHLRKGNEGTFEDVANFAMMLHQRGEDPQVLADAAEAPIKKARGEALELGVRALESKAEQPEQSGQSGQSGLVTEAMRGAAIAEYDRHDGNFADFASSVIRAALATQGSSKP